MSLRVIRERLRRFKTLGRQEQWFFLCATALLPLLSASLRVAGLRRTQQALQKFLQTDAAINPQGADISFRVDATARMVGAAAHHGIGRPTCLEQSLTLWWLLRRQGIPAQLRIGARTTSERFEAHAWVECGGEAVNDPDGLHLHYAAFDVAFPRRMPETR